MGCQESKSNAEPLPEVDLSNREVGGRLLLPPTYCSGGDIKHDPNVDLPFVVRRTGENNDEKCILRKCEYCIGLDSMANQATAQIRFSTGGAGGGVAGGI